MGLTISKHDSSKYPGDELLVNESQLTLWPLQDGSQRHIHRNRRVSLQELGGGLWQFWRHTLCKL